MAWDGGKMTYSRVKKYQESRDGLKDEVVAGIKKLKYVSGLFMSINTSKYQD